MYSHDEFAFTKRTSEFEEKYLLGHLKLCEDNLARLLQGQTGQSLCGLMVRFWQYGHLQS